MGKKKGAGSARTKSPPHPDLDLFVENGESPAAPRVCDDSGDLVLSDAGSSSDAPTEETCCDAVRGAEGSHRKSPGTAQAPGTLTKPMRSGGVPPSPEVGVLGQGFPVTPGLLTTAGGRSVSVNPKTMERVMKKLGFDTPGDDDGASSGAMSHTTTKTKSRLALGDGSPTDCVSDFPALTTASGKAVVVDPAAMEEAKKRLMLDDDDEKTPRLTTGRGRSVSIDPKSLERAKKRLKLDDDDDDKQEKERGSIPLNVRGSSDRSPEKPEQTVESTQLLTEKPAEGRGAKANCLARFKRVEKRLGYESDDKEDKDKPQVAAKPSRRQLHQPVAVPPPALPQPVTKPRHVLHSGLSTPQAARDSSLKVKRRGFKAPRTVPSASSVGDGDPLPRPRDAPSHPPKASPDPVSHIAPPPGVLRRSPTIPFPIFHSSHALPDSPHPPAVSSSFEPFDSVPADLHPLFCEAGHPEGMPLGVDAFRNVLLNLKARPSHVTVPWVANHLRWVAFKLRAMDQQYSPHPPNTRYHTPQRVLGELIHRYNKEYCDSRRSALRRLHEKDSTPASKLLVLKVAGHMSQGVVELTDGWYGAVASLDTRLTTLAEQGLLPVGSVIASYSPEWLTAEPTPPLDATMKDSPHMRLCFNSTRRLAPGARLGFADIRTPRLLFGAAPRLQLSSVAVDGGLIPAVEVVVQRTYPPYFVHFEGGTGDDADAPKKRCIVRSELAEERACAEWARSNDRECERIQHKVHTELKGQCPEAPAPDPEQPDEHTAYRKQREEYEQEYESRVRVAMGEMKRREVQHRAEVLVTCLVGPSVSATVRINTPKDDTLAQLEEGKTVRIHHLTPAKYQATRRSYFMGTSVHHVALMLTSRSFISPCTNPLGAARHRPRTVSTLTSLRNLQQGETFDFLGFLLASGTPVAYSHPTAKGPPDPPPLASTSWYLTDKSGKAVLKLVANVTGTREVWLGTPSEMSIVGVENVYYTGQHTQGVGSLTVYTAIADEKVRVRTKWGGRGDDMSCAAEALKSDATARSAADSLRAQLPEVSSTAIPTPRKATRAPLDTSRCPTLLPTNQELLDNRTLFFSPPHGGPVARVPHTPTTVPHTPQSHLLPQQAPATPHASWSRVDGAVTPAPVGPVSPPSTIYRTEGLVHVFGNFSLPWVLSVSIGGQSAGTVSLDVGNAIPQPVSAAYESKPVTVSLACPFDDGWSQQQHVTLQPPHLQQLLFPGGTSALIQPDLLTLLCPSNSPATAVSQRRLEALDLVYPLGPLPASLTSMTDEYRTSACRRLFYSLAYASVLPVEAEVDNNCSVEQFESARQTKGTGVVWFTWSEWTALIHALKSYASMLCKATLSHVSMVSSLPGVPVAIPGSWGSGTGDTWRVRRVHCLAREVLASTLY